MSTHLALQVTNVVKRYPGVLALDGVSLEVRAGTIVALVGENGAGKSTLMNVLAGLQRPESGSVQVFGEQVKRFDPHTLLADHRVVLVPQELALCQDRSVMENVLLGVEPSRGPFPARGQMRVRTKQLLAQLGREISPDLSVRRLSVADQQLVVIARALARDCRVLILDEPTAVLTPDESERLLALLKRLRATGTTILYVSHRIPEVFGLADEIVVLRDGRRVAFWAVAETTPAQVVNAMVGRELQERQGTLAIAGEPLFQARDLRSQAFRKVSFTLAGGEILGIAGLPDSGRSELLAAFFGMSRLTGGTLELAGAPVQLRSPSEAMRAGVAYVPAERRSQGMLATMTISANLTVLDLERFSRFGFVNWKALRREAAARARQYGVKCRNVAQDMRELSGGNQQKVILARWMAIRPQLLLLDEPTRGIDVHARSEIYDMLGELASEGKGIILSSSDLPELLAICHRIAVMARGELVAILDRAEATEQRIMRFATGVKEQIVS